MVRTVNFSYIFEYVTPYLGTKFGTWRNYTRTRPCTNIFSTDWQKKYVYQKKGRVPHHVPIFSVHTGTCTRKRDNSWYAYHNLMSTCTIIFQRTIMRTEIVGSRELFLGKNFSTQPKVLVHIGSRTNFKKGRSISLAGSDWLINPFRALAQPAILP